MTTRDAEILFGAYLDTLVLWARSPDDAGGLLRAQSQQARARYHAALDALERDEQPAASRSGISMLREALGRRT